MRIERILAARSEAERFIKRADDLIAEHNKYEKGDKRYYFSAPKQSGALRRSSLDPTRSLAEMRKP